ncbi:hypothetical protein [Leifsonia sp. PS1209]|uniref:hypothetical protein n=1 Tax=Leifsonia sp. PS1209 TaxID=2724914 RepID=UPI001442AFA6|nr:hypothetical protein [Leifsonia sp. PS1209]QIZ98826.1 hypothetical protein HF024_10135 [Leifsonia sp. PS1209]
MHSSAATVAEPVVDRAQVHELQSRIRQMQATTLESRRLETHPALSPLLPGGALKAGAAYAVRGSTTLVMAMLAGPSASGAWCGVVGMPDFGAEAAGRFGIDLDRLVLVPHPGEQWLTVTAAVVDVLSVVVVAPTSRARDGDIARLNARLRQREATLIVVGDWPQVEATLTVSRSGWDGLGGGTGYLSSRRVTVESAPRGGSGQLRRAELWLPALDESFRSASGTTRLEAVS